jgi:hypothetical protein
MARKGVSDSLQRFRSSAVRDSVTSMMRPAIHVALPLATRRILPRTCNQRMRPSGSSNDAQRVRWQRVSTQGQRVSTRSLSAYNCILPGSELQPENLDTMKHAGFLLACCGAFAYGFATFTRVFYRYSQIARRGLRPWILDLHFHTIMALMRFCAKAIVSNLKIDFPWMGVWNVDQERGKVRVQAGQRR